jgi:hypothetical protein
MIAYVLLVSIGAAQPIQAGQYFDRDDCHAAIRYQLPEWRKDAGKQRLRFVCEARELT